MNSVNSVNGANLRGGNACLACGGPVEIVPTAVGNARAKVYCGSRCRRIAFDDRARRGRVATRRRIDPGPVDGVRVRTALVEGPGRFGYGDPPYPGKASLYPNGAEVDHPALIQQLAERCPDGWALSTGSDTLDDVLRACPRGVRIASWHRQGRPSLEVQRAWEPVLICGGRRRPDRSVSDALVAPVTARWGQPGAKPPAFYRWIFDLLGLLPGDAFWEPFPGSGAGLRAWAAFQADPANARPG